MNAVLFIILPPITFFIILFLFVALSRFTETMAYKNSNMSDGKTKAYACGEDVKEHRVKVDYSEFFPFAFFFTIMHVITLMIATSPKTIRDVLGITLLFIVTAFLSIFIIFRRERND